jgi:hypothetical protein
LLPLGCAAVKDRGRPLGNWVGGKTRGSVGLSPTSSGGLGRGGPGRFLSASERLADRGLVTAGMRDSISTTVIATSSVEQHGKRMPAGPSKGARRGCRFSVRMCAFNRSLRWRLSPRRRSLSTTRLRYCRMVKAVSASPCLAFSRWSVSLPIFARGALRPRPAATGFAADDRPQPSASASSQSRPSPVPGCASERP